MTDPHLTEDFDQGPALVPGPETNKPITGAGDWNPRYLAYAKWYGRPPEAQLAYDRAQAQLGERAPFQKWIGWRLEEWKKENSRGKRDKLTLIDQESFTRWLNEKK